MNDATMNESTFRDFDFLFGRWQVRHRRLIERLAGSDEWQEFEGCCTATPLLGGLGNLDDNIIQLPTGEYRAASLRSFDAQHKQWAIWWLDARNPHRLDVPVIGGFSQGVGTFYAEDSFNGQPIRVRFRWTNTRSPSPQWEQAFSSDAGKTWEINWTMRFVRTHIEA